MYKAINDKIDFVVTWVDGTDPVWQEERERYCPGDRNNGFGDNRYRDWNLMKFWFRGVETFAPWVNRVFFITNGQLPSWLNVEHPKLRLVSHKDYIPEKYLPTFNSNVIELWLHKIPDLGERFVLFNDDMFLTAPVEPSDFFVKGVPRDSALMDIATAPDTADCFPHMMINNFSIINKHFRKRDVLLKNVDKFFTLRYGTDIMRNICMIPFRYFSCFRDTHLPSSYLKSTFEEVWKEEGEYLETCGLNKFRSKSDYTHWLMKCWQICEGRFEVRSISWGHHFELWEDDTDIICRSIEKQKYHAVCLNDSKEDIEFEKIKGKLYKSFQSILPVPSEYEADKLKKKV